MYKGLGARKSVSIQGSANARLEGLWEETQIGARPIGVLSATVGPCLDPGDTEEPQNDFQQECALWREAGVKAGRSLRRLWQRRSQEGLEQSSGNGNREVCLV